MQKHTMTTIMEGEHQQEGEQPYQMHVCMPYNSALLNMGPLVDVDLANTLSRLSLPVSVGRTRHLCI